MAMTDDEYTGKAYDGRLMRRILKYTSPYKNLVFGGVLLTLLASFLQLVGPYLTKTAIDDYIAVNDLSGLYVILIVYSVVLILVFITQFIQIYVTQYFGQKLMYDIR